MNILEPGHIYTLRHLDGVGHTTLMFVCREEGRRHEGTTNQEVLKALIDRVRYLDEQLPWRGNEEIIKHLQMAIALHESRVIERKAECGKIQPEKITCGKDGHFLLTDQP